MKTLRNQSGQAVVEFVLLFVISVSVTLLAVRFLEKNVPDLIAKPWTTLSGMIECGTWSGCKPGHHPNTLDRVLSYKPDE